MARQKSDNRVVPQGRRKASVTRGSKRAGGGKAVAVNEQPRQLRLTFETAEDSARAETDGVAERPQGRSAAYAEPKSKVNEERASWR
jgi:hypothetical protein